jgi:hypothetical protein
MRSSLMAIYGNVGISVMHNIPFPKGGTPADYMAKQRNAVKSRTDTSNFAKRPSACCRSEPRRRVC